MYQIRINQQKVYEIQNKEAKSFNNVKVFAADNFYKTLNGKIKNLKIETNSGDLQ